MKFIDFEGVLLNNKEAMDELIKEFNITNILLLYEVATYSCRVDYLKLVKMSHEDKINNLGKKYKELAIKKQCDAPLYVEDLVDVKDIDNDDIKEMFNEYFINNNFSYHEMFIQWKESGLMDMEDKNILNFLFL